MKLFKKILLVVLLLPVLLVIVSLFLPSRYHVERTVTMKAKPETVFPWINNLKLWQDWSAWTVARYPDMKTTYAGPESGPGASMTWEGKSSGGGTMKITSADPAKGVGYDLDFEHGKYVSKGMLALQPAGDSLSVTWTNEGDLGANPVNRVFGLLMDKLMGSDMELGLKNLKQKAEAK